MARGQRAASFGSWVTRMIVWPRRVQLVEEPDDLLAGGRVEVAGGLVGEQDRRLADQRAGDRDALPLAAGELVGPVVHAVREADRVERRLGAGAPLAAGEAAVDERQLHVRERRGARQELERLEDEADLLVAEVGEPSSSSPCTSAPFSRYVPAVGVSRQPRRFMSVDLPEPDWPTMATNSPRSMAKETPSSARTVSPPST